MKKRGSARSQRGAIWTGVALLLVGVGAFIWLTALSMPQLVASHFGADGYANAYISRAAYLRLILGFAVGLPLVLALVSSFALSRPDARVNLPNRDYWLAPERRTETISFVRNYMAGFAVALSVFLCYVHWLVVRSNTVTPPRMSTAWMIGGLMTFVVLTLVWTRRLLRRFRLPPSNG